MKVLSVVGARPQFVKLGPLADELSSTPGTSHLIVHTGQHYDPALSDVFFQEFGIPAPDVHLGVGSGSHGVQTGAMLAALDAVLDEHRPDWVVVYGDTNSTLAAALSAVKMHLPLAHVEAGLRSFNRLMPEEHNRVLTDHAADLLLAPTEVALGHLRAEGLAARTVVVGDVMTDVCFRVRDQLLSAPRPLPACVPADGGYLVATIHRAENTDDPVRLAAVISALSALATPVVLLAHPRLVARASQFGIRLDEGAVIASEPLSYRDMVNAVLTASGVVTDSGGLQKEAFLLRTPCTTVRTETEWVETLQDGWNVLDPELTLLGDVAVRARPTREPTSPYGDGRAAERIVRALQSPPASERR
jgi:UDP-N-acetylglucosamine 2-epimerase (non-hydrolysing)